MPSTNLSSPTATARTPHIEGGLDEPDPLDATFFNLRLTKTLTSKGVLTSPGLWRLGNRRALELPMNFIPRDRGGWALQMLRSTPVELHLLLWSDDQGLLALDIGEAILLRGRKHGPLWTREVRTTPIWMWMTESDPLISGQRQSRGTRSRVRSARPGVETPFRARKVVESCSAGGL